MPTSPENYDIVVVGAGPVGLLLSVCLARWGYKIKHIDNRPTPTATGRADGIQPRSLDLLRNMNLKRQIMAHEPAKVYEVAFWDPTSDGNGIHRTGTWASCPKFIDARYPFTTLLHQGHIENVFIEDLKKNGARIQRPWTITGFKNDWKNETHPVEVNLEHVDTREKETVRSRYLFSGEGARSFVREKLGIKIHHKDPIAHVWGVMDGVVRTDFPDIKMKCTIHSDHGSIMIIPREDNMVRLYIQIASSTDKDWNPLKKATAEEVQMSAKRILAPYHIEWDRVEWFSVYPIGQGIAEKYTLDHRIFMGGDACHTHSPKAGQGMNTAFLDAVNLAWKIHHVESGFASRSILTTYESERKLIAENLLNFDAKYAALFSQRKPSAGEVNLASQSSPTGPAQPSTPGGPPNEFVETFKASCELTSGYGISYPPNIHNHSAQHPAHSPLFHPPPGPHPRPDPPPLNRHPRRRRQHHPPGASHPPERRLPHLHLRRASPPHPPRPLRLLRPPVPTGLLPHRLPAPRPVLHPAHRTPHPALALLHLRHHLRRPARAPRPARPRAPAPRSGAL
ncbi:MAG: phenol 2-monooxygenase [Lasallia pustulata]|uniref:Phenol 2-monooxygenase n=1 Tax=Lasallia pustulata TaxID=136370 RepID=A0A5M8PFS8_9LECA|nr:MAG: phenol 2-monooxygenase [Lasallia pustulata]